MPPKRPKPPTTPRSEFIDKLTAHLMECNKEAALRFLLGYYTTVDLEFIWGDLQKGIVQVPK